MRSSYLRRSLLTLMLLVPMLFSTACRGQEPVASEAPAATPPAAEASEAPAKETPAEGEAENPDLRIISKQDKVWVDLKNKQVIVAGEIALTDGQLEMFACPKGTKEHESVVAVDARSQIVHAALLAVGARTGHPVKFDPIYQVATGDPIDVYVSWTDKEGKQHKVRGQDLVRNVKTDKPLQHDWVFGGSGFWVDEDSGERRYLGDGGELICVSNFSTATMDLQIKSSQVNDSLLYEAYTDKIPERGTKVKLILKPRKDPTRKDTSKEAAPAPAVPE